MLPQVAKARPVVNKNVEVIPQNSHQSALAGPAPTRAIEELKLRGRPVSTGNYQAGPAE